MVLFYWSIFNVVPVEIRRNIISKNQDRMEPISFIHNENPNAFCSIFLFYWAWPGLASWPTTNLPGTNYRTSTRYLA
jgi:hypothetical protein